MKVKEIMFGVLLGVGGLALAQSVQRTLNVFVNGQPNADKAIVVNNTSYVPARVLRNFGVTVTAQGSNLLLSGAGGTAPVSSNPNPAPSTPVSTNAAASGTTQLTGTDGRLNVPYTIGRDAALNFTLNAAEYRLEPIVLGGDTLSANGTQKLLTLRFVVQNPNKSDVNVSWSSFKITAVDSRDVNHEFKSYFVREGELLEYSANLKASQRVNLVAGVVVPANANITKLLIERTGDAAPIIRYDLRNQVRALSAPYSTDGFTALPQITAQLGTNYIMQSHSIRVESFGFTTEALDGGSPSEGKRYFTVLVTARNLRPTEDTTIEWSTFNTFFTDADGATTEMNNYLVRASSGQRFSTTLKPNAEARYRYYFEVDQNQSIKQFSIKEGGEGRNFIYTVNAQ
jgi:hypothetical protein